MATLWDDIACLRCKRVGLVRRERVIKADRALTDHYCGSCEAFWTLADDERRSTVRVSRATANDAKRFE